MGWANTREDTSDQAASAFRLEKQGIWKVNEQRGARFCNAPVPSALAPQLPQALFGLLEHALLAGQLILTGRQACAPILCVHKSTLKVSMRFASFS